MMVCHSHYETYNAEPIMHVGQSGSCILGKNQFNEWSAMTLLMAMDFCDMALRSKSNQYVGNLMKWTDYLLSEAHS